MGGLLAGFVVAGLVGPAFATARLKVSVVTNPTETTAGQPVAIVVATNAPLRIEAVGLRRGHDDRRGPRPLSAGPVTARGPLYQVTFELASAAPFGLLWWHKRVVVPRPAALGGPGARPARAGRARRLGRPGRPRAPPATGRSGRRAPWGAPVCDRRPETAGATGPPRAHRGELMVREAERPEAAVPELRVVLPDDGPDGDAVAGPGARHRCSRSLASRSPVMLSTTEHDGPRTEARVTKTGRRPAGWPGRSRPVVRERR